VSTLSKEIGEKNSSKEILHLGKSDLGVFGPFFLSFPAKEEELHV
jgi:hypothetical protein